MFCTACGAKVEMDNSQTVSQITPQESTPLLTGRTFVFYLVKKHSVGCFFLIMIAIMSAVISGLDTAGVFQKFVIASNTSNVNDFLSAWFWNSIPVAVASLALPFFVVSLTIKWNLRESQDAFAKRFFNRQLLVAFLWLVWACLQTGQAWYGAMTKLQR